ncbi:WhiB family transcriptional regulator [Nocardia takedensis]|uniref:WhiB family transcriptional regulator n=1 Tax=Nocardia takedensis TaxID=259390 RepID=UPI0005941FAA|nr:WhiB family transcriptional regulator [Nocardia takedensis]
MNKPTKLPDPATFTDRACNGVDQDVFFPPNRAGAADQAMGLCRGCPRLAECAEWAVGEVLAGRLTGAVTASVKVPASHSRRDQKRRLVVAEELRAVALTVRGARIAEGAA